MERQQSEGGRRAPCATAAQILVGPQTPYQEPPWAWLVTGPSAAGMQPLTRLGCMCGIASSGRDHLPCGKLGEAWPASPTPCCTHSTRWPGSREGQVRAQARGDGWPELAPSSIIGLGACHHPGGANQNQMWGLGRAATALHRWGQRRPDLKGKLRPRADVAFPSFPLGLRAAARKAPSGISEHTCAEPRLPWGGAGQRGDQPCPRDLGPPASWPSSLKPSQSLFLLPG